MRGFWTVLWAAAALAMVGRGAYASSSSLHPPATVMRQLDALKRVDRLKALPLPIRSGHFEGGPGGRGWTLAEPGAAWNATDDVLDSSLPFRRLIFGGCNDELCVVYYERGGIAHSFHIVAVQKHDDRWKRLWAAYGPRRIQDLGELRALLRNQSELSYDDTCNSCAM